MLKFWKMCGRAPVGGCLGAERRVHLAAHHVVKSIQLSDARVLSRRLGLDQGNGKRVKDTNTGRDLNRDERCSAA